MFNDIDINALTEIAHLLHEASSEAARPLDAAVSTDSRRQFRRSAPGGVVVTICKWVR
jgi:hypothetical protein